MDSDSGESHGGSSRNTTEIEISISPDRPSNYINLDDTVAIISQFDLLSGNRVLLSDSTKDSIKSQESYNDPAKRKEYEALSATMLARKIELDCIFESYHSYVDL